MKISLKTQSIKITLPMFIVVLTAFQLARERSYGTQQYTMCTHDVPDMNVGPSR